MTQIIKKVPLEDFISILVELYNKGVNFVDINGIHSGTQDMIQIGVLEEYMETPSSTFSEEDFNNLII